MSKLFANTGTNRQTELIKLVAAHASDPIPTFASRCSELSCGRQVSHSGFASAAPE
ncbi:MAG TPA: hypothetical protein VK620_14730 [Bradyrhizobium sp.]|nr:hypothetical protein [Bradyrhizobium sp.]